MKVELQTFLIDLFASLRDDLVEQMKERKALDPQKAARDLATYDALLAGLSDQGAFPDDEEIRRYVVGLARATDEANGFGQATLEHQAFRELIAALSREGAGTSSA